MKRFFFPLFLPLLAIVLGVTSPVIAGELDDIYRLADEKKLDQAMTKLETFLQNHPKDAQARFLQGLIFTGKSRNDDAIRVFQELGAEFPDLPEPFNNLAVLYAERGDYERSRQALVNAIRILPDYATAHENLGDIYAKLASQSYAHALRINGTNDFVYAKLDLLKKLFVLPNTPLGEGVASAPPAAASKPVVEAAEAAFKPPVVPAKEPVRPEPVVAEPPSPEVGASSAEDSSAPPQLSDSSTESLAGISMPPTTSPEEAQRIAVEKAVLAWARAWSSRNAEEYLAFYSEKFRFPERFPDHKAWENQRRRVLKKNSKIKVTISNLQITIADSTHARATFMQKYWSPRYQDQTIKNLDMQKEGDAWKIFREYD